MSDHRRIQRTLLRMQLDPDFACSVFAADEAVIASTGLESGDLELLRQLDRAAVSADFEGKRRAQILGNLASEYRLSLAAALASSDPMLGNLLEGFAAAPELHAAIAGDRRLPLAFGAYARRRSQAGDDRVLAALVELEMAMARARRVEDACPSLAPGQVQLSSRASLLAVAQGTLDYSSQLRRALDRGSRPPRAGPRFGSGAAETLLILGAPSAAPGGLREVSLERLEPAVAALLRRAERPWGGEERSVFAAEQGSSPAELEAFVAALVADGVLDSAS